MVILKLTNINFIAIKFPIFEKEVDIEKVLVSKKISFGEKTINTLLVACVIALKLNQNGLICKKLQWAN